LPICSRESGMSISTRPQDSTFTGSRYERGTRVNIVWSTVKGAETCLPSCCVCRTFVSGPAGHQALNGFPRVFHGTESVFAIDHQLYAAVPDVDAHQIPPLARTTVDKEVCS
jgi:hypothetical protein